MKHVLCLLALLAAATAAAHADGSSQGYGAGGRFARYDPVVSQYNASGERFRIQGHCQSACTLFLGIRNVCVARSARLLFHGGRDRRGRISMASTQHMLAAYNGKLRGYLVDGHHMETFAFHALPGSALIDRFGYKECPRR